MENMTLKQAMDELEKIVAQLEKGELEIEQAAQLYERAMKLSVICSKKLTEAKQKVSELSGEADE